MFDFLRRVFQEEKQEEIHISSKEIGETVWDLIAHAEKDTRVHVEQVRKEIKNGKQKAELALEKLEKATLQNPDVPVKAIQFMEGNREAYIRKVRVLMAGFDIPEDLLEIPDSCDRFIGEVESFLKSTQKSYRVLQEFFSHESGEVAFIIRGFEKIAKDLKQHIGSSVIMSHGELSALVSELNNHKAHKKEASREILEKEHRKKESLRELARITKRIDEILKSPGYEAVKALKRNVIALEKRSAGIESEIDHHFAVIGKALKKYERIAMDHTDTIKAYMVSPLPALLADSALDIRKIMGNLSGSLKNLGLADKKEEKTKSSIRTISEQSVVWRKDILALKEEVAGTTKDLLKDKLNSELVELHHKKEEIGKEIHECERRIADASSIKDKEPVLEKKIAGHVDDLFGKKMVIS